MSTTMDRDTDTAEPVDAPGSVEDLDARAGARRWWILGVLLTATAAAAITIVALNDGASEDVVDPATSLNFAEVVRTDLTEVQSYDATLGTVEGDPVRSQLSGTVTSVAEAGTTVGQGEVLYTVDGEPVVLMTGAGPAYRDIGPTEDTEQLVSRAAGTVTSVVADGSELQQGDILFTVDGEPVVVLYGDTPMYRTLRDVSDDLEGDDILQLETALDALGYNDAGMTVDGTFTGVTEDVVENWQEAIGAEVDGIVELGDVIFIPGPTTVVDVLVEIGDTLNGGVPVVSTTGATPLEGEDVRQLEQNLSDLGYDAEGELVVDGVYDDATGAAIAAWQAAMGIEADGIVDLGTVVFLEDSIRVSEQLAPAGTAVAPGTGVLAVSSADKVVTLDLPAEDQELVSEGDAVVVELPDGTDVPATISAVATVASVDPQGNAVFEVTIVLDDPAAAAGLDEAPVDVEIITDSVQNATAIPVTALVALAEGGYAVELETAAGGTRLVAVDPGFFADGLVEIESADVTVGDRVVVP